MSNVDRKDTIKPILLVSCVRACVHAAKRCEGQDVPSVALLLNEGPKDSASKLNLVGGLLASKRDDDLWHGTDWGGNEFRHVIAELARPGNDDGTEILHHLDALRRMSAAVVGSASVRDLFRVALDGIVDEGKGGSDVVLGNIRRRHRRTGKRGEESVDVGLLGSIDTPRRLGPGGSRLLRIWVGGGGLGRLGGVLGATGGLDRLGGLLGSSGLGRLGRLLRAGRTRGTRPAGTGESRHGGVGLL